MGRREERRRFMARDMNTTLFDIDSKKIELDFLQQQFLIECKRFTAHTMDQIVRTAIVANPETVLSLGKEGLIPIKEQVTALMDHISNLVEAIMNDSRLWLHTQEELTPDRYPVDHYRIADDHPPAILEAPVKTLFSPLGDLLMAHGLDGSENWETCGSHTVCRRALVWSQEMVQCILQYNEQFNALAELVEKYESLSVENSGADALSLWDSL
jgi:hypothetical protein